MSEILFKNPWVRAFLPLILMGVASFTVNALVVEITIDNKLVWKLIPEKVSFYLTIFFTILLTIYEIGVQKYHRELARGFTPKQYEASIRNKVAEGVAKRSLMLIKNGDIETLEKETEIFTKLYGEKDQ